MRLVSTIAVVVAVAAWTESMRVAAVVAGDDPPAKDKVDPAFGGRTGKEKARLLKEFGGSEKSEEAVMLGLAWLTQVQKNDGSWVFDIGQSGETAAASGLAMLAFLGAGQSHKAGRYQQTVQAGLNWLLNNVDNTGRFQGAGSMYGQGIATLALCEAYGLTQDEKILATAQLAIDYIQKAQADNGSWGYQLTRIWPPPNERHDNSIVGWQVQALHAAQLTGKIKVDPDVIKKSIQFLDISAAGATKSMYGYIDNNGAGPATNLTAIGLLMRYYIDDWRAKKSPGFDDGVKGLMTRAPALIRKPTPFDIYYYYYATQVVRFFGGEDWTTWNEGLPGDDGKRHGGTQEWLISLQDRGTTFRGSWPPEHGWIGPNCGRLGTTAFCLLTLEVYYRYTPENANDPKK